MLKKDEKLKVNIDEIKKKNEVIDNAVITLKKEFVGIDKQIDEIMDNVRTWYLFPQLQIRPLVVAIWGMSGCGKTSLVKRISQLLDIEEDLVYFNFASISESSSWEIEQQIEDELSNEKSNRMFVYDEFQYAATLNGHGEEKDSKTGLKPFWELLDSGILHKRSEFWSVRTPYKVMEYMTKINMVEPMKIENGVWVNAQECLKGFRPYDIRKFREVFNFDIDSFSNKTEDELDNAEEGPRPIIVENKRNNGSDDVTPFFIKEDYLNRIINLHDSSKNKISDQIEIYHKLEAMSMEEIFEFIADTYMSSKKGYDLKFNDSIIFVIGNLDEAYEMSFDVNPDMSPDQFRKITEEISVVDIKEKLRKRFRNEQIARMGNIHVIYPSFSQKNFEDIIQLSLDRYEKDAYDMCGYHLRFADSIKKIVYDEGVFPTHGTRPIFSSVHEIVKSRLPQVIRFIFDKGCNDKVDNILYEFDNVDDKVVATCFDKKNKELCKTSFDVKLRLKKMRDSDNEDDFQAMCALHESGHFVVYASLFGKMPEKLVSKTTDTSAGGFMMEDYDANKKKFTKNDKLNEIRVLLGGYVAEKLLFGKEMSNGASNDLKVATKIASKMIRFWGFGDNPFVTTYQTGGFINEDGNLIREENQNYINQQIKQIITNAEEDVMKILKNPEWYKMLKESATYLTSNSAMPKEKMQEIYDNVADSVKTSVRSETHFRDIIAKM